LVAVIGLPQFRAEILLSEQPNQNAVVVLDRV